MSEYVEKTSGTILIVDDNSTNLMLLFNYLTKENYQVLIAENGEKAIERALLTNPDLIILDVLMPGIDGFETCKQLKINPVTKRIPVVFTTALHDNISKETCLQSGGIAYLSKPIFRDDLINVVNQQLNKTSDNLTPDAEQLEFNPLHALQEINAINDIAIHGIRGPLINILGFAEELEFAFGKQPDCAEEWIEFIQIIKHSTRDIETILESLVILQSLRNQKNISKSYLDLESLILSAQERYQQSLSEESSPLSSSMSLRSKQIWSNQSLFVELILIFLKNIPNLQSTISNKPIPIHYQSAKINNHILRFTIQAETRPFQPDELKSFLMPFSGLTRQKVIGTNLLMLCAQKIIEKLCIRSWTENYEKGIRISLEFEHPIQEKTE